MGISNNGGGRGPAATGVTLPKIKVVEVFQELDHVLQAVVALLALVVVELAVFGAAVDTPNFDSHVVPVETPVASSLTVRVAQTIVKGKAQELGTAHLVTTGRSASNFSKNFVSHQGHFEFRPGLASLSVIFGDGVGVLSLSENLADPARSSFRVGS